MALEADNYVYPGTRLTREGMPVGVGQGMTMRDWFAGQALASVGTWMPAHGGSDLGSKAAMQARALWAYEQADAMMAERVKGDDHA